MSESVLYDVAGPVTRRRIRIWGSLATLVVIGLLAIAVARLAANGQFDAEKYRPFIDEPDLWSLLWRGLRNTLVAAAYSLVLALAVGTMLGIGRLSTHAWIRIPSAATVEVFRAVPLLLLILFFFLAFPRAFGITLSSLQSLVLGLTLYNGAVIAEIVRAGVLALPRGQSEAGSAIGLRRSQLMRHVLLPQGFQVMLPALVSQLVVLVKDSSLGFIVGYRDLLASGETAARQLNNPIQMLAFVALIYITVNSALSWLAHRVEARQRRRFGIRATASVTAVESALGSGVGGAAVVVETDPDA